VSLSQQPNTETTDNQSGGFKPGSKALWTFVFIAISALSIWAVVSHTKDFSATKFLSFAKHANPAWLCAAILSMLGFIVFEGIALITICRSFGYKTRLGSGFVYSASDIYFSAITPSATGGQPASAFFMIKDSVPGTVVTVALLANLVMYTAAIVILGIISFITHPSLLANFSAASTTLIVFGFVVMLSLLTLFIMLVFKKGLLHGLCRFSVKLAAKLHIIRNADKKLESLNGKMESYSKNASLLAGKGKTLFAVFIFNLLQRVCQIAVTAFTYLAEGGSLSEAANVFFTQTNVTLGSHCIPIPGAMGVTDYLMLDGFGELNIANPAFLELLSRSLSFYICIIICGLTTLVACCALSGKDKRRAKK